MRIDNSFFMFGARRSETISRTKGLDSVTVGWMKRSQRRSPQERRWLRLLSTLNEFQARLFAADKAWDEGRGGSAECPNGPGGPERRSPKPWLS
jgi:hypothetical protein